MMLVFPDHENTGVSSMGGDPYLERIDAKTSI